MGKKEKLVERFKSKPSDFTWNNAKALLGYFGYELHKGSGSKRKFVNKDAKDIIIIHKPHPGSILDKYNINDIYNHLKERGLL